MQALKSRAERFLQDSVDRTVITVPAHFTDTQRLATMSAAMAAGIERVSLLQEPVAAAMSYGLGKPHDEQPAILVFDLGGGTFDVSLLQSFEGIMEVVGSDGDNQLGGFDLDTDIMSHILDNACTADQASSIKSCPEALENLRRQAEQCKIALSTADSCTLDLSEIPIMAKQHCCIKAAELREVAQPFLRKLWPPLESLGAKYKLAFDARPDGNASELVEHKDRFAPPPRRISQLVLVGGATKAPIVSSFAERLAGVQACQGVDPEHCVALGAAVQAGIMDGSVSEGLEMMDSLYVKSLQGRVSGFQM